MKRLLLIIALLAACNNRHETTRSTIAGRSGAPLYQIEMIPGWSQMPTHGDTSDTMLPIAEFLLYEDEGQLRITVHNFPQGSPPPEAQVARWQQQLDMLTASSIEPQAFAGFAGLHLWAEGTTAAVSAWSLRLAPEHVRALSRLKADDERTSDITIKAVGPKALMESHKEEIAHIARSFEFLTPLPIPW